MKDIKAETLAEVKRLCRLYASTETNYQNYNLAKTVSQDMFGAFWPICKWEGCDIYKNTRDFIVVYHYKNCLELYKPIL